MSYLEELLPEFRNGVKIRKEYWHNGEYINMDENIGFYDEKGNSYYFSFDDFKSDDWELYKEPINWECIIENRCLCWFWDEHEETRICGILARKRDNDIRPFFAENFSYFKNCRPVRRDEIAFYED